MNLAVIFPVFFLFFFGGGKHHMCHPANKAKCLFVVKSRSSVFSLARPARKRGERRGREREAERKGSGSEREASTMPAACSCRAALLRLYLKTSACFG